MGFKYRELADSYIADIRCGELAHGQRLPSIRALSKKHGVSITTAIKTFELLEAEGHLVAQAQAGFFVRQRASGLDEPFMPSFSPRAKAVGHARLIHEIQQSARDAQRVPLGTVMLSPALLPVEALQRSLIRASKHTPLALGNYGPSNGEPALLDALCSHFGDDGIHLKQNDLQITNGCMSAVSLAIHAVTAPGDVIALPSPCFSGQLQLIASLGRKVIEMPSSTRGFDIDRLERILSTGQAQACLITANFQNPLGYCLSPDEKRRIAALATAYRFPVIEDDVFGECGHDRQRPLPIKCWDNSGDVIWCGSFSKTLAPGYRIGWCAPGRYAEELSTLHLTEVLAVNSPLQLALADFIRCGEYRRHLKRLHTALAAQVDQLRAAVVRHFPGGCRITDPQGGYALWVQLPEGCDGLELYERARESDINIVPGVIFSARDLYRNYVRLNAGNPWRPELQMAIEKLAILAAQLRPESRLDELPATQ